MQLSLNRDYARRHAGVALLFLALSGWFAWDAAIKYPSLSDADLRRTLHKNELRLGDRETAIGRQWQFAALALFASLVVGGGVVRRRRETLAWDDERMVGTLTGGKPLAFADIESVDFSHWRKKGIARVKAKDGRRVTLDAWHHTGVDELVRTRLQPPDEQGTKS